MCVCVCVCVSRVKCHIVQAIGSPGRKPAVAVMAVGFLLSREVFVQLPPDRVIMLPLQESPGCHLKICVGLTRPEKR